MLVLVIEKWFEEELDHMETSGVRVASWFPNLESKLIFYLGEGFVIFLNALIQIARSLIA